MDRVSEVAAGTDYDHYARRPDGLMIPQTSSPEAVAPAEAACRPRWWTGPGDRNR